MKSEQLLLDLAQCESDLARLTTKVISIHAEVERLTKARNEPAPAIAKSKPADSVIEGALALLARAEAGVAELQDLAVARWGRGR